ncbi:MAG TPA: RdgB/HAM1 family non-canonical purine NTP pyrophosphatase [Hellea balneolensis]|uniref:dITP/XTP pyrophosphatase n=1 Tax=Hellea balneolensis TaxID=287478 RepID=A0A7C5LRX1_9PROT|nr:RdgB/HAM1 family non-canonical purine NTP pyrophosphatase [Hellea balneolensis]
MRHPINRLVVASHNGGKVREIRELLKPYGVRTLSAADLDLVDPEETGTTFEDNAALKARLAADASGMPALADDSGLVVDALGGAPGIHSARYAENEHGERDFDMAMAKLWAELTDKPGPYSARFVCALALAFPNTGETGMNIYTGVVEGEIVWPPRGQNGFGYDPVFRACGDDQTFGELDPAVKHAKSHRAHAFSKFIKAWFPNDRK